MRIATWNVNGLAARLPFVVHWLRARRPDVVALQELKLLDEKFPAAELEREGYRAVTHGQKAWNGVAILARSPAPIEVVQCGLPGQEALGARLLTARVADLLFTSVYCPNGKYVGHPDFPTKLAWLDTLIDYVRSCAPADCPSVLGGDFNLCPGPLDSWNEAAFAGEIFHTAEERERFARLLACGGLHDLFRARHPDLQSFSWWDYRAGAFHQNHGLRIDLLLATRPVLDRVKSVETDREYRKKKEGVTSSDHAPVFADLEGA
jgi:exodeoxyribonuclease-3